MAIPGCPSLPDSLDQAETRARLQSGDEEALRALFEAHSAAVYALSRRLCRRPEDAEEIVQETFLVVSQKISTYRGEGSLEGWIRRIAARLALQRLRRRTLKRRFFGFPTERLDQAPAAVDPADLRLDLESAVQSLPELSRAVLWLHDVEGYTHREIAKLLRRSVSFSKSRLARAHDELRRLLGPAEEVALRPNRATSRERADSTSGVSSASGQGAKPEAGEGKV